MNKLDALCKAILENRYKSIQKCIDLYYDDLVLAKDLYGWAEVTNFINQKTDSKIKDSFLQNMVYRASKKNNPDKNLKTKKTSTETLQKSDNVENKKSDSFKSFKNLNRISLGLIDKYDIDLEKLKSLGVMTIQDRSIVEGKIKNYCQSIDNENLKNEYSHILKKDN
ncbi:hypothetical protein [Xenorhabdus bovienii]|uniref:hypothetical protein n=1 Tax=Xenorhabdus bovienii TaxID=40576 RepID=UPI0023B270C1|nr:hypothetical protein [Xenorhabdus bovienii]MDE9544178.1 hypothetical protein [Xenorhabdus bovienii]